MKITWHNIDDFKLGPRGGFRKGAGSFILREGIDCCSVCGDPYFIYTSNVTKGNGATCSLECGYIQGAKQRKLPMNAECYWCGKAVRKRPSDIAADRLSFCDNSCHQQSRRIKHGCMSLPKCAYCGIVLDRTDRKYCNAKCSGAATHARVIDHWKHTGIIGSRPLKVYLARVYGSKCTECGISSWNGKSLTLELEHRNGNSEDNSEENVCLLCPNCHSQTSTYKAKNIGNGRHARRERYAAGKSY